MDRLAGATTMTISTREQFDRAIDDAERMVAWLSVAVDEPLRQLLTHLVAHLSFARQAVAGGRTPEPAEKQALALATACSYLPHSLGSTDKDQALGWLRHALPAVEDFFRRIERPRARAEAYALGTQVTVRMPDGARQLGFIRCPQETSCLVAFANGSEHWLDPRQLEAAPGAGEQVAVASSAGWRLATVVGRDAGRYLLHFGDPEPCWVDWDTLALAQ